ncbi:hypothetical protein GSY74_07200 [Sulfurovum sp. bin170]|uniref:type IV pili methyl-accepting chemotaxis transducer N-terminal domain-containing protein n=1 Tax=Sulfurovum sp. bin170 TaxID=2695268 RepID=UPI0013DFA629|nr:type IV pili methyl-accepting chemotaxis transducer N-terminal domain-containing protein [Sulfurovum sp. bin170]NEW61066.1 hypothetical protein [Sulfurovum sp. bin170]
MKHITTLLALLLLFSSSLFALSDKELAISINLSGKQRMLSQKMTKESFLIRSDIDKKENIEKLTKSSQLFDKTLKGLMAGDKSLTLVAIKNEEIQTQLKKVETLWIPFYKEVKSVISGKAENDSYDMLEQNNITLLKEMNRAVGLYTSSNKGKNRLALANDINLAGKQRMLTQKMGKTLLFASNDFKKKEYIADFKKSQKLFTETLNGLFYGSKILELTGTKLPQITTQLKEVDTLWKAHQPILKKAMAGKEMKQAIAGLDNILVEMNKGVFIYTQSVNRQKQRARFASLISSFMSKSNTLKKRVNLSGRQRMLTQRMTKLAILVSSNINKQDNAKKLIKFSNLYNKTLMAFRDGDAEMGCIPSNGKEIKEQISIIEKEWNIFYEKAKLVADGKDKDGQALDYMISKNENLLKISNELVKKYEKSNRATNYLDKARLHIVNVAGRQRMLTQKMTKEKLLIAKGKSEYSAKLEKTIKLFDDSLNALINGDKEQTIVKPTSKKIKEQLATVEGIWKTLKPLYIKPKPSTKELKIIIKQNPILLAEMNKMVKMSEVEIEY